MPMIIIPAPMILFTVICSPSSDQAMNRPKMRLVPLNIYASDSSVRFSTCCHKTAYTPITPTAPASHSIQGHEGHSCREAIFVKMDVQA